MSKVNYVIALEWLVGGGEGRVFAENRPLDKRTPRSPYMMPWRCKCINPSVRSAVVKH